MDTQDTSKLITYFEQVYTALDKIIATVLKPNTVQEPIDPASKPQKHTINRGYDFETPAICCAISFAVELGCVRRYLLISSSNSIISINK